MVFNDLWAQYEKELSAFVRSRVNDSTITQDIMQEVAIKIFIHQDKLESIENIKAWLYRVTRNTLIDFLRKYNKKLPNALYVIEDFETTENDNTKIMACFEQYLDTIKVSDKEILKLQIEEQYSIKEIAKLLNLSVDGAKSKLKRAKAKVAVAFFSCCSLEKDVRGNIYDFVPNKIDNCECC